jgi:hypothetical protein
VGSSPTRPTNRTIVRNGGSCLSSRSCRRGFRRLWETENRIDGAAVNADLADYDLDQLGMVPFSKAVRGGYRSNPVDRGKSGSKIHVLSDHTGVPLTVLISAANVHDSQLMVPLLDSIARSVLLVAGRGTGQASCTRTRRTTSERYAPRSAAAASECASPARASSPRRGLPVLADEQPPSGPAGRP